MDTKPIEFDVTLDPEERHAQLMQEMAERDLKESHCMMDHQFDVPAPMTFFDRTLTVVVSLHVDFDDDWDYLEIIHLCKNYLLDSGEINNSSLKAIADDLFMFLVKHAPGRHIRIKIHDGYCNGVTINYNQK